MTLISRRLLPLSSGMSVAKRKTMSLSARAVADRRDVERSMLASRKTCSIADQKTQQYVSAQNQRSQQSHALHDRRRLTRRTFVAASVATLVASQALADTPFTSFAFPGTGFPTNRTMPARIADIFNVLDFGADPTGVSFSSTAIQAAITAAGNQGTIYFPKGNYTANTAVVVPEASGLVFVAASGASVTGNFNGFIFDNLSDPYNAAGAISSFENFNIANTFVGNQFSMPTGGTWSASGSPTNILLSGSNPGVAAGGALWMTGLGTNSVFIGMITSVASWPTVTVSSAAVASGANPLTAQIIQCYAAGGSFSAAAGTITMAATRPAGIGTGLYYVYDYEFYLADARYDFPIGVASWSGTTVTFTPTSGGSLTNSVGSSDRLWFAPVAGCIRYSSVVGAKITNCFISGFRGITTSEDKIPNVDGSGRSAQGFHVVIDTCTFSNPSGFSGLMGQTGVYLTNNSIAINSNSSGLWCAERLSGTTCGIIGGRCEVNHFGIIIGGDFTASNNSLSGGFVTGRSMESNLQGLYCKGGGAVLTSTGCSCNALSSTVLGGFYLSGFSGTLENVGIIGNFGTSYGLYIADPGNNRGHITCLSTSSVNNSTPANGWRIPAQAWWGTCISSDNPALEYAFSGLPTGSSSPTPFEGETYDISDCNTSTFLATAAAGGSGATAHRRVRWNASSSLWQVVG